MSVGVNEVVNGTGATGSNAVFSAWRGRDVNVGFQLHGIRDRRVKDRKERRDRRVKRDRKESRGRRDERRAGTEGRNWGEG